MLKTEDFEYNTAQLIIQLRIIIYVEVRSEGTDNDCACKCYNYPHYLSDD